MTETISNWWLGEFLSGSIRAPPYWAGLFPYGFCFGDAGKWGKTDRENIHSLAHHSIDVAEVFARIMQLPIILDRLEEVAAGIPLGLVTS